MGALKKPLQLPATVTLADLSAKLDQILAERAVDGARADAYARFQTTGELALPMTARQVAAVLDLNVQGVYWMQRQGWLARRWVSCAGFHPDDVRAALEAQTRKGSPPAEATA